MGMITISIIWNVCLSLFPDPASNISLILCFSSMFNKLDALLDDLDRGVEAEMEWTLPFFMLDAVRKNWKSEPSERKHFIHNVVVYS